MNEIDTETLDIKIAAAEEELRAISPEAVNGGKAKARALELREQIDSLNLELQLLDFAHQEEQRRQQEAAEKADLESRDQARRALVEELDKIVATETRITKACRELVAQCAAYRKSASVLSRLSTRTADDRLPADYAELRGYLAEFLKERLVNMTDDEAARRKWDALETKHTHFLDRARATLDTPLPPRSKRRREPVHADPVERVWIEPPSRLNDEKEPVPVTVLVEVNGRVREVSTPTAREVAAARSYYRGGSMTPVKPEDISVLLNAGHALKKGLWWPTSGSYTITETLKPTGDKREMEVADAGS